MFKGLWSTRHVSDLKAPTYEYRNEYGGTSYVGRAFTVRRPSFREATFSRGGGAPKMSDLKAPTYEYRNEYVDASPVGRAFTVRRPFFPRRSCLYGPTAIFSRSDIFKRRGCTEDVGPEGTDLRIPKRRWGCIPVGRAFTVRRCIRLRRDGSPGVCRNEGATCNCRIKS